MGEAALAYLLDEFINPTPVRADTEIAEFTTLPDGETDEDWRYGSD